MRDAGLRPKQRLRCGMDRRRDHERRRRGRRKAGQRADRRADRAMIVVVSLVRCRPILVFVVTDQKGQQRSNKIMAGVGACPAAAVADRMGEIEGEMNRHKGVETQRSHAEPRGNRLQPQPIRRHR